MALGAACEVAAGWIDAPQVKSLRDRFWVSLQETFGPKVTLNGPLTMRLPNTLSVNFSGHVGADILSRIPQVAASIGSASHAGSVTLSPVLAAMGVPLEEGMGAVRFSLGRSTTWEELEEGIYCLRHLSL